MAKKSKAASAKQQTVAEFKAWLTGIMEFQPKDWCPDPMQWKAIQERISNLKETVAVNQAPPPMMQNSGAGQYPQSHVGHPSVPTVQPAAPTSHLTGGARQMQFLPEDDGAVPPEVIVIPDETAVLTPGQAPSVETITSRVLASGGKKFRTPSDLSGKPYTSGFK